MRILTKQKIDRISKEAARMERKLLSSSSVEVSDEFVEELTRCFEKIVKMTGGEYGYGRYSAHIVDHYTQMRPSQAKNSHSVMGKVIAFK